MYIDTENNEIITESELYSEFIELSQNDPNEYNYTFKQYLNNCLSKNGFLKKIN